MKKSAYLEMFKYLSKLNFILTSIVLFCYCYIRFFVVFLRGYPKGDEASFLSIFDVFIKEGYYKTNVIGNSSTFNIMSYLFYKISSNELISLRLTSLLFGILSIILLWYFYKKHFKIPNSYRAVAFLTAINTMVIMSWVFMGINDLILSFLTILFFIFIGKLEKRKLQSNYLYLVLGGVIALMLVTRKMSVIMFPAFIAVFFAFVYQKKNSIKEIFTKGVLIVASFLLVLLTFNLPSLKENTKLSFHDKKTGSELVNWPQLAYLSAIGEEQGTLSSGKKYFTLDQVALYLKENGQNSLPKTYFESIFFNFKRTIKEFFKDLIYEIKPFTRLLGLLFIFNLILFFRKIIKIKTSIKKLLKNPILLFSVVYVLTMCFVIIHDVETRWFSNILLLLPIVFMERVMKFKKENNLGDKFDFIIINLQLLSLTAMSLPYLIKNIGLLF